MKDLTVLYFPLFIWIFFAWTDLTTSASTTISSPTTSASTDGNTRLSCYDCTESFKYTWDPYTECQYYPTQTSLRECLTEEKYCMVERVKYRDMTVNIQRGCTEECWHGCAASGFGLTKLKCTSCCMTSGCNVGDDAIKCDLSVGLAVILIFIYLLRCML